MNIIIRFNKAELPSIAEVYTVDTKYSVLPNRIMTVFMHKPTYL